MDYVLSETEIQNSILEWLHFKGIYAWRNNSAAIYDTSDQAFRRKSKYDKNGISDILGILPCGKLLAIEVKKDERKRASKDQSVFIQNIKDNQGIAMVAWSVQQVAESLKKYI